MSYIYSTINHIGLVINNILSRFIRIFYTTPIVKSTLTKYGKNLLIIGPIIKLDKNIKIFIGDNCFLSTHMEIKANNNNINELYIKDNVDINYNSSFYLNNKIVIGNNVKISTNVIIGNPNEKTGEIIIEDDVWITHDVSIANNIRIGKNSIIATGSVVTQNVPENVIVAGNPARIVKYI